MYQWLPVNIVGQTYQSRSLPLSAQSTIGLYPEFNPTGRTQKALHSWLGSIRRVTSAYGANRGSHVFKSVLYKVSGTSLVKVDENLAETLIGTIAGANRCIFADDGNNLIIVTGSKAYQYDLTTLTEITDPDLESPDSVAVLNNQLIYDGNNGRWVVASAGDPDDIPDINYAVAESNGDDLVRVYVFNQIVYLMGTGTIEPWFNSGSGNPPFSRIDGGIIEHIGLFALHSAVNTKEYLYFLGSDKNVYRISGYQAESITPPATSHQFFRLQAAEDAIANTVNIDAQDFYILTFPTANKTYVFSEQLNVWFNLTTGSDEDRYLMDSYQFVYGRRLVMDYRNGNVLELDYETFTDDTELQVRQRDTVPINGIELKLPAQKLIMSSFRLILHTGVGLESGQGSSPLFFVGTSIDGGRTFDFSGNPYINPGESGNNIITVQLDKVLEFEDLIIRIRVTDPIFVSIHGAAILVDKAGEW